MCGCYRLSRRKQIIEEYFGSADWPPVHDRMPVILDRESYDLWLDPGMTNVEVVSELLKPYDARLMRAYAVSSRVNHVGNDDEECSHLVAIADTQNRLFA